ncbi:MOSC domain-containing protein [Marinomonas mediterranea]|uniref:MOSC domain-containing protein n=1 Tax=Marinomonas mediterranea TaxID=119864 RepID=UPI00234B389F|nr:MOSC domain-containing protein [Marinomonas mediterranea]WCN13262.1 MOSC domain-containing protein [Marinomonas mediterranea]
MFNIESLAVYPIKSIKGIPLHSSVVNLSGLAHDRRYIVTDTSGNMITARTQPTLTLVHPVIHDNGSITLTHPKMTSTLELRASSFENSYNETAVFKQPVKGQNTTPQADEWFSELLGTPVNLLFFGENSQRFTSRRPESPVAFADGYPFLLTNTASLEELNRTAEIDIDMRRFRSNIVVSGAEAFEEDSWKIIQIGEVKFENVKPCARCKFTTIDPDTAEQNKLAEPLRTLAKFRKLDKKGVTFGVNLIALNEGKIKQGDKVEIIEYQTPETYLDKR